MKRIVAILICLVFLFAGILSAHDDKRHGRDDDDCYCQQAITTQAYVKTEGLIGYGSHVIVPVAWQYPAIPSDITLVANGQSTTGADVQTSVWVFTFAGEFINGLPVYVPAD